MRMKNFRMPPFPKVYESQSLPSKWQLHRADIWVGPRFAVFPQALVIPARAYIIRVYPEPMETIRYGKTDEA